MHGLVSTSEQLCQKSIHSGFKLEYIHQGKYWSVESLEEEGDLLRVICTF